jgi:predicted amidophosphoribosyltransferase
MPSVTELSDAYGNFMLSPRAGADVCRICFNLTDGHTCCYACAQGQQWLDAFVPISYSVSGAQLHHALAAYKRLTGSVAERLTVELTAVLWRFLAGHEPCLAAAAGVARFQLVTSVPSADPARTRRHPLERIVELLGATAGRRAALLERSSAACRAHAFDLHRFAARRRLAGESVLLIDDTWTTGANAQSAAAVLKRAGADRVAAVVIGRYVNREWRRNNALLSRLETPFDWNRCPLCASAAEGESPPAGARPAGGHASISAGA